MTRSASTLRRPRSRASPIPGQRRLAEPSACGYVSVWPQCRCKPRRLGAPLADRLAKPGGRMTGYIDPTKEAFAAFRADDRPGPIHMLNLVKLRALAAYPDGRKATGAEAYAAYGRESEPVFSRLGGSIVWRGRFEQMLIGPSRGALGSLLHRSISERRRLRRHDPRPRLPRSGQAPAGGGGGFAAHPPRARRGRGRLRLNPSYDESHRNQLPLAAGAGLG